MAERNEDDQTRAARKAPQFRTPDGKPVEVPPEGSLSLLAMGYVGLMAWREARIKKAKAESPNKP